MKSSILLLPLLLLSAFGLQAQYHNAFGVQGGITGYGLGYRSYVEPEKYIEVNLVGKSEEFEKGAYLDVQYGWHKTIKNSMLKMPNLSWFYSLGLQGGYYSEWLNLEKNSVFGLNARLGMETVVREKLVIGAYGRPYYNILHTASKRQSVDYIDAALYVRFVLN